MLWQILVQFLFRLAFGLTAAMASTSPRWVTAGFYRVHLWVGLGLNTLIAAIVYLLPDFVRRPTVLSLAVAAAILSYVGAVIWLYERTRAGQIALVVITAVNLVGGLAACEFPAGNVGPGWHGLADTVTAGMLLGTTFTAMLLGHWYLNTPTMKLLPLQRLVALTAGAALIRACVEAPQLQQVFHSGGVGASIQYAFVAIRWLAGLAGLLLLTALARQTLKIPNTQSATGILYVAVIFAFLGELASQLLSVQAPNLV
jgi:hypothetical protein